MSLLLEERSEYQPTILVASVADMLLHVGPTYERLKKRRKIPPGARISGIRPAHFKAINNLHRTVFTETKNSEILRRLSGKSSTINYCERISTLVLLGDDLIGMTLVLSKKNGSLGYVYAVVIESGWRNSWATVYLKYHSLIRLQSKAVSEIAFQALDGNLDTLNWARRTGARVVADSYIWND